MAYTPTNWQNLPDTTTPIIANKLNNMETGIKKSDTVIGGDEYDSTAAYEIGDFCIYNNKLYRCTTAISTAEAFTPAHWEETSVEEELDALRKSGGIPTNSVIGYDGSTIPSGYEEITDYEKSYELTNLPAHSVGTNVYQLYKIGKLVVLNINSIWFDSLSGNTWTAFGSLPNDLKPSQNMGTAAIVVNGSNGQTSAYGRVEIKTDGTLNIRTSGNVSSTYGIGIGFSTSWVLN